MSLAQTTKSSALIVHNIVMMDPKKVSFDFTVGSLCKG